MTVGLLWCRCFHKDFSLLALLCWSMPWTNKLLMKHLKPFQRGMGMGRAVASPSWGSRRNVNWKPSQKESSLPTPVERFLNRQEGCSHHVPRWRREDTSGTAQQSVLLLLIPNLSAGLLRRTRKCFNSPILQGNTYIFPAGLTPTSKVGCNFLVFRGRERTKSNLESWTGQGMH